LRADSRFNIKSDLFGASFLAHSRNLVATLFQIERVSSSERILTSSANFIFSNELAREKQIAAVVRYSGRSSTPRSPVISL